MNGISARQFRYFLALRRLFATLAALLVPAMSDVASAQTPANAELLQLQIKIPLGSVRGRIDHMAIDLARQRLLVAELGNDSVGVVDLKAQKRFHSIDGLAEPQGVGYVPSTDTVYVANARDGSVRLFHGGDYGAIGRIDLGSDADNIRLDSVANRLLVGYGDGGLAVIDVAQTKSIAKFALAAHPESFQIDPNAKRVFVNIPGAHAIAVLDTMTGSQTAKWPLREGANFPMALDNSTGRVLVVSRNPPKLIALSEADGSVVASAEVCGDSDDLFIDPKRGRIYVSCGEGFIDVFETQDRAYRRVGHIATAAGARTSLFVPDLDVFLLAVRATAKDAAAIWVFKPLP